MLRLYSSAAAEVREPPDLAVADLPPDVIWLDLLSPEAAEIAFVERTTGLAVPTIGELSEIESSSRLRSENGVLYLSAPLVTRSQSNEPCATPIGFVLNRERLITVRFEELTALDGYVKTATSPDGRPTTGTGAFVGLVEAIVDRLADVLEHIAVDLDGLSHRLFRAPPIGPTRLPAARETADLRAILRRVGGSGDLVSTIRDSLLGFARIVPFVNSVAADWLPPAVKSRLETLRQDVLSLNDYNAHLVNKVQLLLDATLGLINVEQNNIIKVLTIVSVVGVPPTLVASIYGMNFKGMPELSWSFGYPYGLAIIALSAVLPLLWFKWRGWF